MSIRQFGLGLSVALCASAAVIIAAPTYSQTRPMPLPATVAEATIYRDMGYSGPAVAISEDKANLGLAWRVNSIRIKSGRWQLCERTNFRGDCRTIDSDRPMLNGPLRGMTVQSIRLVDGGAGGIPIGDGGPSLRGMSAQFYTQPMEYGNRVRACTSGSATSACASRAADNFCRNMGWTASASERMETVNRTIYLADVLCTQTGY